MTLPIEGDAPMAGSAAGGPLLEVNDLEVHFKSPRGVVRAVDGVSFTLEQGSTLGVVGESGSGKTVLSRALLGLTPRRSIAHGGGEVRFEGRDLRGLSEKEMRGYRGTQISMVFQDPMTALNPVMKVGRQIAESLRAHFGTGKAEARSQAIELLTQVGIPSPAQRVDQYPHELSGGMRQRVMIAIALSGEPKLLIADEPTTALDVTVQAQILNLLQRLQEDRGMAIILVSHDLAVVAGRTDEIAVMYAGRIVEKGPSRTMFSTTRMPYTKALLSSIPKVDDQSHVRLQVIPGRPPDLVRPPDGCRFNPRCPRAGDLCRHEEPALVPDTDARHEFRCWYPLGGPAGPEAEASAAGVEA